MAPPDGLLLSDDLIFTSRITGTATALHRTVRAASSVERLQALALEAPPRCLLIDLALPGLDLPMLRAWCRDHLPAVPRFIAYGPHVEAAMLRAAREAGCDSVLPRSRFVELLPNELAEWLA